MHASIQSFGYLGSFHLGVPSPPTPMEPPRSASKAEKGVSVEMGRSFYRPVLEANILVLTFHWLAPRSTAESNYSGGWLQEKEENS